MGQAEAYETRVLPASDPAALDEAVALLTAGLVVAFPTDTVYGVGCDLWREDAIERLYRAKGRPSRLAIPVLVAGADIVSRVGHLDGPAAELCSRFWPGALTVVVRKRPDVPDLLTSGQPTVAVRMPDHAFALDLIARVGGALATTSANISGRPAPETAEAVLADLQGRIPLLLDGGPAPVGVPSSIVDLASEPPRLLREGALSLEVLREALPALVLT
jgi:L-threonylcarbamoyladenylate synthase